MEGRLAGFVAKTIEVIVRLAQSHRELQEMAQGIVKEERILCVCVCAVFGPAHMQSDAFS